jgi:4-hydroxy-3-polyprenylbenzoate decarboxylase
MLAGFLKNQSVKLVKSITNDIYVPENADFVLEGYVDPKENFKTEGPFGDHTGFYSLADEYPIFHLTCITHRKDAVYPATIVGVPPMEDFYLGKATERIFLKPIQISIAPEIMDFRLPSFGVAHNLVLIKAKTHYAGQSIKIMNSLLGAGQMMFSKVIVCFDESIDIQNDSAVFSALLNNVNFSEDIVISRGPTDVLDHSSYKFTYGGKLLIDATQKAKIEKAKVSKLDLPNEIGVLFEESGFCIIGADKKTKGNLLIYGMTLVENQKIENIKVLVIVNDFIRLYDKYLLAWYVLNNIDPSKDCKIHNGVLIVDASIKTKIDDDFNRLWPNPVTMDLGTIENADKIWKSLFPNKFIESPSKRIFGLIRGDSAVAEENHKSQMTMSLS